MRGLFVICFVAVATALPQGYNYQEPAAIAPSYSHHETGSIAAPSYSHHEAGSIAAPSYSSGAEHVAPSYSHSAAAEPEVGIVTKNFYTHTAPEETEDDILSDSESTGPTNKKYNVVFVKAPGQSAKSAALALRKAQSNEKTLIYVLTKKLDIGELQNALSTTDSHANKPQVAFIKYKTPQEAAHVQHQIQQQYEGLGGGPSFVGEEEISPVSSVVGSLGGHGGGHHHAGHAGHGGHISHSGHHAHGGHIPAASSSHGTGYLPPIFY